MSTPDDFKFYIPPQADDNLKQTIRAQEKLARIAKEMEVLKDNKQRTIKALREFAKRQEEVFKEFPYPHERKIRTIGQLKAFAREEKIKQDALLAESQAKGYTANSAFQVKSIADLAKLAKLPTEEIIAKVMAKKNDTPESETPEKGEKKKFGELPDSDFHLTIFNDRFSGLKLMLEQCKLHYFNLPYPWYDVIRQEQSLKKRTGAFGIYKQKTIQYLLHVLSENEDQTEKLAAAQILASFDLPDHQALNSLLEFWKENEELTPIIMRGFMYSSHPELKKWIETVFNTESDQMKAHLIEIAGYHCFQMDISYTGQLAAPLETAVLKYLSFRNQPISFSTCYHLLDDPSPDYFKDAVLTGLLEGDTFALEQCRGECRNNYEKSKDLPLLLACAGDHEDLPILKQCLKMEIPSKAGIQALGIYGCPFVISELIELLKDDNSNLKKLKEMLEVKDAIVETLELITAAGLPKPLIEVVEGKNIEKGELEVFTHLYDIWNGWWLKHRETYEQHARWRRGSPISIRSFTSEMEYSNGNYWSRQYSGIEMMIRYGKKIPFQADWYVKDQRQALEQWQRWVDQNRDRVVDFPWLFNGQRIR